MLPKSYLRDQFVSLKKKPSPTQLEHFFETLVTSVENIQVEVTEVRALVLSGDQQEGKK